MSIRYFVPIDFSEHSHKPVQYALMLARESGGSITLGHVIDVDQITESDNQAVVRWSMDRLEQAAVARLSSLVEMASLSGIPACHCVMFGYEKRETLKMIRRENPDVLVVLRKQRTREDLASFLVKNCSQSVLVVPEACEPQVPARTLLTTDSPPAPSVRDTILKMVWQTSKEISILDMRKQQFPSGKVADDWAHHIRREYGMDALLLSQNFRNGQDMKEFIGTQPIDLLCTVRGNRRFLFGNEYERLSKELINSLPVPVMVVSRN